MSRLDPRQAVAEAQLERLDDERVASEPAAGPDAVGSEGPVVEADPYGFHVDDPDADLMDDDLDAGLRDDTAAEALDAVAEAFNARDLEALLEIVAADGEAPGLLGYDRDNLGVAIEDLWTRRPTACLVRGRVDLEHVGVLWEHDGGRWWRVAVVHVDDVADGQIGVLEFTDDPSLVEQVVAEPPDEELEEGARWSEWEDGVCEP